MKCVHDIISLGGGVQSTTLYLMAVHGELKYTPQLAVFADTQCESKKVYHHLKWLNENFNQYIPITTVSKGNLMHDALFAKLRFASMPLFVFDKVGKVAMIRRQCTGEYKIEIVKREIRKHIGGSHYKHKVRQWLGISTDEMGRMKINKTNYIRNYFPLVEETPLSRIDCMAWLTKNGYPIPPKSACIICPFHSNEYWQDLKTNEPEEFEQACVFDEAIRWSMSRFTLKSAAFLHRSMKPLREVDFTKGYSSNLFYNLECSGNCFL